MKKYSVYEEFKKIQDMQFELDEKRKKWQELGKEVRSLAQRIPQKIRELKTG